MLVNIILNSSPLPIWRLPALKRGVGCLLLVLSLTPMLAMAKSTESTVDTDQSMQQGFAWLERMTDAMRTQNYRGIFVYSRGNTSSSMKVMHRFKNGVDRERLVQLDGEMGEILRTGDELVCVLPGNKVVSLDQSIPSGPFAGAFARRLMPNKAYYRISLSGEDRVAGHQAVKVAVMAKDANRYSYVLWLEKPSGLLLRSHLINAKGEVLEQFNYTSLELDATISDAELESKNIGEAYSHESVPSIRGGKDWTAKVDWRIGWLPDGFMSVNKAVQSGDGLQSSNVQVFTDGLASFSVFIESPSDNSMPEGATVIGATVAYAHRLQWQDQEYRVTVVGEVPIKTAIHVAKQVVPNAH